MRPLVVQILALLFLLVPAAAFSRQGEPDRSQPGSLDSIDPVDSTMRIEAAHPLSRYHLLSRLLAEEEYERISALEPASPGTFADWVFHASTSLARALDLGDSAALNAFPYAADRARFLCDEMDAARREAVDFLLFGSLQGAEAQYYMEVLRQPLKALGPAEKSADAMRKALALDSTLFGARLSLALYDFWRSNALRGLAWTPFVTDKREQSIATLYEITRRDTPYRVSATIGLSWALIEVDRPIEAAQLADSLNQSLGKNLRGLLEPAGKGYYLAADWERSRARYLALLHSLREQPARNVVRETGILHRLVHISSHQQDWLAVVGFAEDALSLPLNDAEQKRKRDDRKRIEQLLHRARTQIATP